MASLRRQIYGYSKGHIAYHLTTLIQDHDLRALPYLLAIMPARRGAQVIKNLIHTLRGKSDYSLPLLLIEIAGNLAGPWSLWRSHQRVKREGHSGPYIPAAQRLVSEKESAIDSQMRQVVSISEAA
jgi:hypothetical protein